MCVCVCACADASSGGSHKLHLLDTVVLLLLLSMLEDESIGNFQQQQEFAGGYGQDSGQRIVRDR